MKKLILLLVVLITTLTTAQNKNKFEWPSHEVTPVFKDFTEAYNSNDLKTLEVFTAKYYPEEKSKQKAIYWSKIFTEYGPLKPYKIADEKFHGLPAIWFYGTELPQRQPSR